MGNPDFHSLFQVARTKAGLSWRVMVRRRQGHNKYISDFETEADAEAWVNNEGLSWMAKTEGVINRA
jgi:3-methyladenine DNA glycosylase Tag